MADNENKIYEEKLCKYCAFTNECEKDKYVKFVKQDGLCNYNCAKYRYGIIR